MNCPFMQIRYICFPRFLNTDSMNDTKKPRLREGDKKENCQKN